jgi:hypothetical protein
MSEVIDRLIAAADRVGMEGARLWPDVVRITFLTSVFWAVETPLMVAAILYGAYRVHRGFTGAADEADVYDRDMVRFFCVMTWGVCAAVAFSMLSYWPNSLSGVFFPEAKTVLDLAAKLR